MPLLLDKNLSNGGLPVRSLSEYLSSNRVLDIPPWQREYSWSTGEDDQIDTLLKDLKHFIEDENAKEYLIGSIVLCELPESKNRPLLIDGQQRTITLSLLLMCIRKFLKSKNLIDGGNNSDTALIAEVISCLDSNPDGEMRARISMKQASANITLGAIYEWSNKSGKFSKDDLSDLDMKNSTQENLVSAVEFIYKKIAGFEKRDKSGVREIPGEWIEVEKMKNGVRKLLSGVKIIEITVDNKRESISVFDHINNRGLALNPADLVKNLMFEQVADREFPLISENWSEMCESLLLNKKTRLQDPRYLLRAISHVEYGAHEGYDKLDVFWSSKFKDESEEGISAIEFSRKLPRYATSLKALVTRDPNYRGGLSSIFLAGELGSVQHYSVLLAGQHLKKDSLFQFLCHQVNVRTLIYMFGEERTQLFDSMVPKWAHKVYSLSSEATIDDLKQIYADIRPSESLMRDLKDRISEWSYEVPGQKKKIRAMLGLLSAELNEKCGQRVPIEDIMRTRKSKGHPEPYHLDHIFPKSKAKESSVFHSLGNLTLLEPPGNLAALDALPASKGTIYSQCNLILTKTLCGLNLTIPAQARKVHDLSKNLGLASTDWNLQAWDEASVAARIDFLYRYFCKLAEECWK